MALNFLLKTSIQNHGRYTVSASLNHRFEYFLDSMFVKKISTNSNEQSFTVSYLINSCGLSPEFALKASEKLQLETPEKADLVLTLFKNSGFSETQISDLIGRYPLLLLSNPEKNLLPKLEFFLSKGFSSTDLGTVISRYPNILGRSLNNHIIPSFTYLSNLLQSTEKVIRSIKRYPSVLNNDLHILVQPKFNVLRDIGVPERRIIRLFHMWPRVFINYSRHFDEAVDLLKKMGMDPLKSQFDKAIVVMSSMSKSEWDKKVDFYKRLGLSEEDILSAFRKNPWCMVTSKDKITGVMDFFVNKMGWEPSAIAHRPILLSLSLEKRIIPRAAVVQFLSSKGLLKTNFISLTPYNLCDERFLQKFVNCYDEAPQLKKLYKEKLDLTKMVK
ncbi:transcription termination factor MTERF4, chloroplastic-like [Mangifera indica]|uniref:transcription termination factor MTERF4, chloroplastic-like n=1 Tax=Mangifera indica TaxID=29780 RepID=UPI001CFBAB18|nr:transcription termination factor MTERF4, chloroplastic-like [Mangifera indica]XP_044497890.1 transcription termination factor MTERF4, chloroplastic-like [Mangifera indica]